MYIDLKALQKWDVKEKKCKTKSKKGQKRSEVIYGCFKSDVDDPSNKISI